MAYENALDTGGFDGIKNLYGNEQYGDEILDIAVEHRLNHPFTKFVRTCNCVLSLLTILSLTIRNIIRARWFNESFSKSLIR